MEPKQVSLRGEASAAAGPQGVDRPAGLWAGARALGGHVQPAAESAFPGTPACWGGRPAWRVLTVTAEVAWAGGAGRTHTASDG